MHSFNRDATFTTVAPFVSSDDYCRSLVIHVGG